MRKPWIQHWMEEAVHVAQMSTCAAGRKVGAVFVKDQRVISTGFNGVPVNYPHPLVCIRKEENIPSGEGLHKCACAHAETNGIANAARSGVCLLGSTLYSTTEPCVMCMGSLANVGITEVVYKQSYHHKLSVDIARYAGINVVRYVEVNGVGMLDLDTC